MSKTQKINLKFKNLELSLDRELTLPKHINIVETEKDLFKQFTKISCDIDGFGNHKLKNHFNFHLLYNGKTFNGKGVNGNDALWIPFSEELGLKIVSFNEKYHSLRDSVKVLDHIKNSNSNIFPKIDKFYIDKDSESGHERLLIFMENVKKTGKPKITYEELTFVPTAHHYEMAELLPVSPSVASNVIQELIRLNLEPEDGWYKNSNFIESKIIDFHRFKLNKHRYIFPSRGIESEELLQIYTNMVNRYSSILDSGGLQKWKGKIYQGFKFDNSSDMEGYCSDNSLTFSDGTPIYDSYRKLPFFPVGNLKNKKVLDLGSNQGFFSFQAALAGAKNVVGVEITKPDVDAANDIKKITGIQNVKFICGDAIKFVEDTKDVYGLVILNSVLHQIYPNFSKAEKFMKKIASCTETLVFETPLNHKYMRMSPKSVQKKLIDLGFKHVRLVYIYDAYSSGYRANYVCHTERYEHPEKFLDSN